MFILSIKPLVNALHHKQWINGLWIDSSEFKLSLFVDNLVNSLITLPPANKEIDLFSSISGFRINYSKILNYPLNTHLHNPKNSIPYTLINGQKIIVSNWVSKFLYNSRMFLTLINKNFLGTWSILSNIDACLTFHYGINWIQ